MTTKRKTMQQHASMLHGIPLGGVIAKGDTPDNNLHYFRFIEFAQYPGLGSHFRRIFGNEPSSIYPIYLRGETPDDVFSIWNEQHNEAGRLLYRCDGVHRVKTLDESTNEYDERPLPCLKESEVCQCNRRGRLHFNIPALVMSSGYFVRFMATTGSFVDITNMFAYLREVYTQFVELGAYKLHAIPFELYREPIQLVIEDQPTVTYNIALRVHVAADNGEFATVPGDTQAGRFAALFARHLPVYDGGVEKWVFDTHGESLQNYLATRTDIDVSRDVVQWAVDNGVPLAGYYLTARPNKTSWRYDVNLGFATASHYSRKLFDNAGYDVSDWRRIERNVPLNPAALCVLQQTTTNRLKIVAVEKHGD